MKFEKQRTINGVYKVDGAAFPEGIIYGLEMFLKEYKAAQKMKNKEII